ncbi:beta-ketoacyl-[acyl-carrier-protein] synthase family protein [Halocola ammonii]
MNRRVVVTGLGVCAPNGTGVEDFTGALKAGRSGITYFPELEELDFRCQVGGAPNLSEEMLDANFSPLERKRLKANGVIYGVLAAREAWLSAGLEIPDEKEGQTHWGRGAVFGAGISGIQTLREAIYKTDDVKVRKLGTSTVEQTMPSGISAFLSGKFGLGNWVTTNASACSTGTESVILATDHIRRGRAEIMIAGSCDAGGPYVWGGFDAMRVLNAKHNESPQTASRPMAADAGGFVPGSGAGALILESLESAQTRGAKIYAEVLGGHLNSGGQRNGGSMTAPNEEGIQNCIRGALADAEIGAKEIDLISGHLTATKGDVAEVKNWSEALGRSGADFPRINALKSLIGHCLSAAGSIENVAAVLQLSQNFLHPSINCEEVHPGISAIIDEQRIVRTFEEAEINVVAKSSFGFGDVNSCVIFKKYTP